MESKVEVTCVQCGKAFMRTLGEINRTRKAKSGPFCSRGCRNTHLCKGKKYSEEYRAKLRGRIPWNKGRPWSPEMRAKLSELASNGGRSMEKNGHWKGGKSIRPDGYIAIRVNGHPKMEHIHLMEQHLGRPLEPHEIIHHKNEDRQDNRIENLEVTTIPEHMRYHHKNGILRRLTERTCVICGKTFLGKPPLSICSEDCKRLRQRQYWRKHDAKRRGHTAEYVASS